MTTQLTPGGQACLIPTLTLTLTPTPTLTLTLTLRAYVGAAARE